MLRKMILATVLASLIVATNGSSSVAQEAGPGQDQKPSARTTQDADHVPTSNEPDPRVKGMLDEMHRASSGHAVPQSNKAPDTSGNVGGRPFFSNNPNDQPK
jgi:hypothetical protein